MHSAKGNMSTDHHDGLQGYSFVNLYFMCQDDSTFKSQLKFAPYLYLRSKKNMELDDDAYLHRRFEGQIASIKVVQKEDPNLKNHLSGCGTQFEKLVLMVCKILWPERANCFPSSSAFWQSSEPLSHTRHISKLQESKKTEAIKTS